MLNEYSSQQPFIAGSPFQSSVFWFGSLVVDSIAGSCFYGEFMTAVLIMLNILNNFFCNKCAFRSGEFAYFPHVKETNLPVLTLNYFLCLLRENSTEMSPFWWYLSSKSVYLWECIFFLFIHCDHLLLVVHFSAAVIYFCIVSKLLIWQLCCFLRQLVSLDPWFPFHLTSSLCYLNFELSVLLISSY